MPGPGDTVVASVGLAVHSLKSAKLPCVHADSTLAVSLAKGAAKGTAKGMARGTNNAESSVTEMIGAAATFRGLPRGMISFEIYFKTTHVKKMLIVMEMGTAMLGLAVATLVMNML